MGISAPTPAQSQTSNAAPTPSAVSGAASTAAPKVNVVVILPFSSQHTLFQCDWAEHTAPDGRTYYYNSVTRESAWEKPDALKTPEEREALVSLVAMHFSYLVV